MEEETKIEKDRIGNSIFKVSMSKYVLIYNQLNRVWKTFSWNK